MVFAAEHDVPIPYMQRTRDYYATLGYPVYRWAHFVDVPFTPLLTPLARARLALVTTAAPHQPGLGDQGPRADVVQPEVEPRHDAEVATTAAQPPEEVRVLVGARAHQFAAPIQCEWTCAQF